MVMPYHLHMPSYFLETFTEYPNIINIDSSVSVSAILYSILKVKSLMIPF